MAITTDRDKVRLLVGDTDTTNQLFQDDEIAYFLEAGGNTILLAAAFACDAAAAKYSREFDYQTDDQRFQRSQRAGAFVEMAKRFRNQATGATGVVPTKVDGYSQEVAADEVQATSSRRGRQNYFTQDDQVF